MCERISTDFSLCAFNDVNEGFSLKAVTVMIETLVICKVNGFMCVFHMNALKYHTV